MSDELDFLSKYPRTEKALKDTGMSLSELYIWTEIELKRLNLDEPGG